MNIQTRRLKICKQCPHYDGSDHCELTAEWVGLTSMLSVPRNACKGGRWKEWGPGQDNPNIAVATDAFRRWDGDEWTTMSLKGMAAGSDLYLCCPGPSLAELASVPMRGPGRTVLAVNTAWPSVDADLWIGVDHPWCFDESLWHTGITKIIEWRYRQIELYGQMISQAPQAVFVNGAVWDETDWVGSMRISKNFAENTFTRAMQLAMWSGADRIFLVGVDLGGSAAYHDDRELPAKLAKGNVSLYKQVLSHLKAISADDRAPEIVSCTPDSSANAFLPYVPLDEAVKSSAARVSHPDLRIHSRQIDHCKWGKPLNGAGVITGCDHKQEWMLPWWHENLRLHSDAPVTIFDFGLSEGMRAQCREWGNVVPIPHGPDGKRWWKKPFAVLASPYRQTLWLDVDCGVYGDISPLLEKRTDIGLAKDGPATKKLSRQIFNSGVIAVSHGLELINDWARGCYAWANQDWHYGDQDVLAVLIDTGRWPVDVLDPKFNSLRLRSVDDAVISHYTGPDGKAMIRDMIDVASDAQI